MSGGFGWRSLNTVRHRTALAVLMAVLAACLAEKFAQAVQQYLLGFPPLHARGLAGHVFPWLALSPWPDRFCGLAMLAGLVVLGSAFIGRGRWWWAAALVVQCWHHFEYLLLLARTGASVPAGVQLLYNTVGFFLMVIAMICHRRPGAGEWADVRCTCAVVGGDNSKGALRRQDGGL